MTSYNPRVLTPPEEEVVFPYRRVWRSFAIELLGTGAMAAVLFAVFTFLPVRVPARFALPVNLLIAVVPLGLWLIFSLLAERTVPEPRRRLVAVVVVTALAANAIGLPLVNNILQLDRWLPMSSALTRILGYTFTVGIIQETLKYATVRFLVWPDEFRTRIDGVAYCVASAIGYATVLNVSYALTNSAPPDVMAMRVFDTLAIQYATSVLIGYGLSEVRFSRPTALLMTFMLALASTLAGAAIPLRAGLVNANLTLHASSGSPIRGLGFSAVLAVAVAVAIGFLIQNSDRQDREAEAGREV